MFPEFCIQLHQVLPEALHLPSEVGRSLPMSCMLYVPPKTLMHLLHWANISWQFLVSVYFCPLKSISILGAWAPNTEQFGSSTGSSFQVLTARWGGWSTPKQPYASKYWCCWQCHCCTQEWVCALLGWGWSKFHPEKHDGEALSLPQASVLLLEHPQFTAFWGTGPALGLAIRRPAVLHSQAAPIFPVKPTHWWTELELVNSHSNKVNWRGSWDQRLIYCWGVRGWS